MARERTRRPERTMKPVYIVFCEGETEENYVTFLRVQYRVPIKVVSRIVGQKISQALIDRHQRIERLSRTDLIVSFVMYDLDDPVVSAHLRECKAIQLTSNPCIELWFLLHEDAQRSQINTEACLRKLKQISQEWLSYSKGSLTRGQEKALLANMGVACGRARELSAPSNPSSSVYKLIEMLDDIKK